MIKIIYWINTFKQICLWDTRLDTIKLTNKQEILLNLFVSEYWLPIFFLDEAQAGIKIARRNINNLRYTEDTTLMAENEEEIKSFRWKWKRRVKKFGLKKLKKFRLKLNIQKTKIMASGPIISCQIDRETMETVADFIFLGSKITAEGDCSHEINRCSLGRKAMTNLDSILKSRDIICQQRSV